VPAVPAGTEGHWHVDPAELPLGLGERPLDLNLHCQSSIQREHANGVVSLIDANNGAGVGGWGSRPRRYGRTILSASVVGPIVGRYRCLDVAYHAPP
jgi:hypothetical protein